MSIYKFRKLKRKRKIYCTYKYFCILCSFFLPGVSILCIFFFVWKIFFLVGLVVTKSLNLIPSMRMPWFLFHYWKIFSLDIEIWVANPFLFVQEKCCSTSSWPPWFKWEICYNLYWFFPIHNSVICFWLLSRYFLFLYILFFIFFRYILEVQLSYVEILFGICSSSWICRFISFVTLEKFLAIVSLNTLSIFLSFSFPSVTAMTCLLL